MPASVSIRGIVACNRAPGWRDGQPNDRDLPEVVVAPDFTSEALAVFELPNLRLLQMRGEANQAKLRSQLVEAS